MNVSLLSDEQRTACAELLGDLLGAFIVIDNEHRQELSPSGAMGSHLMFKRVESQIYSDLASLNS